MPAERAAPPRAAMRVRDPDRRERILAAAAELIAGRGYHAVSMAEIGAAAGVVGSAVYRHFDSKAAVLVALLDRVLERLLRDTGRVVGDAAAGRAALDALVRGHVDFAIDERILVQLYQRELLTLPEEDRRRLRRVQRRYVEEWVHVLAGLRPELPTARARTLVHAAIGAIQSAVWFSSGLPRPELADLLGRAAHACLEVRDTGARGPTG
jgi:AcrR family transcriptional regulator